MSNAKDELARVVSGTSATITCAVIKFGVEYGKSEQKVFSLRERHSTIELDDFLNSLDFDYDSGYGSQKLFGTVWLSDDTWLERGEYDGSEWWEHRERPPIPEELRFKIKNEFGE